MHHDGECRFNALMDGPTDSGLLSSSSPATTPTPSPSSPPAPTSTISRRRASPPHIEGFRGFQRLDLRQPMSRPICGRALRSPDARSRLGLESPACQSLILMQLGRHRTGLAFSARPRYPDTGGLLVAGSSTSTSGRGLALEGKGGPHQWCPGLRTTGRLPPRYFPDCGPHT